MGGPCFLLVEDGSTPPTEHFKSGVKWAPANPPRRRISGPACTDNFQVAPFMFDGAEWQSVEQCYQAYKFNNIQAREHIRAMVKLSSETDHGHGMRVWAAGGSRNGGTLRSDWDAVRAAQSSWRIRCYVPSSLTRAKCKSSGHRRLTGKVSP